MEIVHRALDDGYSQREIAEAAGVSESMVTLWLNGTRRITKEKINKIKSLLEDKNE